MRRDKAFTIVELLVVAAIFFFMTAILAPVIQMAKERAQRVNCANSLRKISLALHMYAADHEDSFPPTLGDLYPNYVREERTFSCPASKVIGTQAAPNYFYAAGLNESSPPKTIIAEDIDNNHKNHAKNVLRIDGSIDWVH